MHEEIPILFQPEDKVEEEELKQKLEESLEVLTEKERKVILLYYYEDLTLKEISSILEVSESRISQLHTKALLKMQQKAWKLSWNSHRTESRGDHYVPSDQLILTE